MTEREQSMLKNRCHQLETAVALAARELEDLTKPERIRLHNVRAILSLGWSTAAAQQ